MDWKAERPAIEIAAEWIAAASVGGAIAFAVWGLAPLGSGILAAAAAAAGVPGAIGALVVMNRVDRADRPLAERFVPVDFSDEADVLVLDDPIELVFEYPLPAISEDSRVVRLFAVPPTASDAAPLPAPGEMAARIETFLGVTRTGTAAEPDEAPAGAADASAALHAALADIRRSLRQA
jgi:hypothetical protein